MAAADVTNAVMSKEGAIKKYYAKLELAATESNGTAITAPNIVDVKNVQITANGADLGDVYYTISGSTVTVKTEDASGTNYADVVIAGF